MAVGGTRPRDVSDEEFLERWADVIVQRTLNAAARRYRSTVRCREERECLKRLALWETLRYHRDDRGDFYWNLKRFANWAFLEEAEKERKWAACDRAMTRPDGRRDRSDLVFDDLLGVLPELEAKIVNASLRDIYNTGEIAAMLGTDKAFVARRLRAAVRQLRSSLLRRGVSSA